MNETYTISSSFWVQALVLPLVALVLFDWQWQQPFGQKQRPYIQKSHYNIWHLYIYLWVWLSDVKLTTIEIKSMLYRLTMVQFIMELDLEFVLINKNTYAKMQRVKSLSETWFRKNYYI